MGLVLAPLFVTVHNPAQGISNPRSVKLIEALQAKGGYTTILASDASAHLLVQGCARITLFDCDKRVNRYSPMLREDKRVPSWAKALSTRHCVAMGRECHLPAKYAYAAKQMLIMFRAASLEPRLAEA